MKVLKFKRLKVDKIAKGYMLGSLYLVLFTIVLLSLSSSEETRRAMVMLLSLSM